MKNKALFLDRDGTIIELVPYIKDPERVSLIPGIVKRIKDYQSRGFLIIVITNQSGIARGLMSEDDYDKVNQRMLELLSREGAKIDAIFMCPSHPDANDPRRKPNPGMILEAAKKHDIDLPSSMMVGDDPKDIEAGKRAGVGRTLHIRDFLQGEERER